jgi:hypothetical protein
MDGFLRRTAHVWFDAWATQDCYQVTDIIYSRLYCAEEALILGTIFPEEAQTALVNGQRGLTRDDSNSFEFVAHWQNSGSRIKSVCGRVEGR